MQYCHHGHRNYVIGWPQEPLDEEAGIKAVHEAFKSGINYFDTSPYYGDLRSERVGCCHSSSAVHVLWAVWCKHLAGCTAC